VTIPLSTWQGPDNNDADGNAVPMPAFSTTQAQSFTVHHRRFLSVTRLGLALVLMPSALSCAASRSPAPDSQSSATVGSTGAASSRPAAAPPHTDLEAPRRAIAEVALSTRHGCARDTQGGVLCWGTNDFGQVSPSPSGRESASPDAARSSQPLLPTSVDLPERAARLAVNARLSCAVLESGEVHCWGVVDARQDQPQSTGKALRISGLPAVRDISLGQLHACAVGRDGRVLCWGDNRFGQLGLGTRAVPSDAPRRPLLARSPSAPDHAPLPAPVPGVLDAISVVSGDRASCALLRTGVTACWGDGFECAGPVAMPELGPASALSGSSGSYCAVRSTDGAVLRLPALDTSTERAENCHAYAPRERAPTLSAAQSVVCGRATGCALLMNGRLSCFDLSGEELDPLLAKVVSSHPRALGFALSPSDAACLITPRHRLLCWGDNRFGQLGVLERPVQPEPVEPLWERAPR
jgi:hypothetical protein